MKIEQDLRSQHQPSLLPFLQVSGRISLDPPALHVRMINKVCVNMCVKQGWVV